jgi:hypothetical protein
VSPSRAVPSGVVPCGAVPIGPPWCRVFWPGQMSLRVLSSLNGVDGAFRRRFDPLCSRICPSRYELAIASLRRSAVEERSGSFPWTFICISQKFSRYLTLSSAMEFDALDSPDPRSLSPVSPPPLLSPCPLLITISGPLLTSLVQSSPSASPPSRPRIPTPRRAAPRRTPLTPRRAPEGPQEGEEHPALWQRLPRRDLQRRPQDGPQVARQDARRRCQGDPRHGPVGRLHRRRQEPPRHHRGD